MSATRREEACEYKNTMKKMRSEIVILLKCNWVLIFLTFPGCATIGDIFNPSKEYPIVLYVDHNEHNLPDSLNVVFIVDRDTIVNQNFSSRIPNYGSNWAIVSSSTKKSEFNFKLSKGTHQIVVESKNADAGLDVIFSVDKPLWLFLDYWGKNHFQLNVSERPMGFM